MSGPSSSSLVGNRNPVTDSLYAGVHPSVGESLSQTHKVQSSQCHRLTVTLSQCHRQFDTKANRARLELPTPLPTMPSCQPPSRTKLKKEDFSPSSKGPFSFFKNFFLNVLSTALCCSFFKSGIRVKLKLSFGNRENPGARAASRNFPAIAIRYTFLKNFGPIIPNN